MTNRNSPPRAAGAQGSFDCRREAPGGPRTGPQLQAGLRPKAIRDQGPVRGPLDRRSKRAPRFTRGGVLPSAQKTMAANSVRCRRRDRGESVKGGRTTTPPRPGTAHKSTMTNRNSPPRAAGAQGSFDCRREAPGGPRTGPQLQAGLRPKAIRDQGPVRGPLDRRSKRAPRFTRGGVLPSAQKTMAANSVRCRRDRGESVKGGPPPLHKSTMTNRNSPPRAAGAQGSFDCRREAPGGPRTGPQLQAGLRPKAIRDQGPVRGPLDPDCRVGFASGC